jgi:hypothetical protein
MNQNQLVKNYNPKHVRKDKQYRSNLELHHGKALNIQETKGEVLIQLEDEYDVQPAYKPGNLNNV